MEYILIKVSSSLYNAGKIMSCVNVVEDSVVTAIEDMIKHSVSNIVYDQVYYLILDEVSDSLECL